MKKVLLVALCASLSYFAQSQTKGTIAVGFGFGFGTTELTTPSGESTSKNQSYSLSYGNFVKENVKLSIEGSYQFSKSENSNSPDFSSAANGYSGGISYHRYFPVIKKLYAFGGGGPRYSYTLSEYTNNGETHVGSETNQYLLSASGGVAYFVSKRISLELNLLSASAGYSVSKSDDAMNNDYKQTQKFFGVSSSGTLSNLGFQIYFLF